GTPCRAAAPGPVHAQEPAAPAASGVTARRADDGPLSAGARRPRGRRAARRDAARAVQRQGVLRPAAVAAARAGPARGDRPGGAAVSVPHQRDRRADQALSQGRGDRLGAGGAAQHGAPEVHEAAAARARGARRRGARHRPARALESRRGVPRRARRRAGADRHGGAGIAATTQLRGEWGVVPDTLKAWGVGSGEWYSTVRKGSADCTVRYHSPLPTVFDPHMRRLVPALTSGALVTSG